jgi:LysR family transcriptional regulator, regulator of gene expression of beta-lactamase
MTAKSTDVGLDAMVRTLHDIARSVIGDMHAHILLARSCTANAFSSSSAQLLIGVTMTRLLPSLNGLRAFEASGRHGSFTAAAKELNVTQTAVSRMVRLLEQRLGFLLFRRHANALELTPQGKAFLSGLTDSFDSIARLAEQVAAMRDGPVLTVGVAPTLAVNWLIPRLIGFYRSHPEVEVRMATGGATRPVRDDWTCTIRRDTDAWPGYIAENLFPSALVPVCTPAIASGLRQPSDLRSATLIFVPHLRNEWPCWFEAAGLRSPVRSAAEVSFDSNAMAIQAVFDGVGIAVAQLAFVGDALAAGRLVAPFPIVAHTGESWLLQYRPVRRDDPALLAFRDWVHGEAEGQRQVESELLSRPVRQAPQKDRHKLT